MNVVSTDMDDYLKSDQKDNPDKWMEITNIEGDKVYLNKRTGQTTFLKPTGVQGVVGEHDNELWFWVPNEKEAYVPAKLIDKADFENPAITTL